jgi:hypothetical protein
MSAAPHALPQKGDHSVVLDGNRVPEVCEKPCARVVSFSYEMLLRYAVAMFKRKATHFRNSFCLGNV